MMYFQTLGTGTHQVYIRPVSSCLREGASLKHCGSQRIWTVPGQTTISFSENWLIKRTHYQQHKPVYLLHWLPTGYHVMKALHPPISVLLKTP